MRDVQPQHEIVVPGDARRARAAKPAPRRGRSERDPFSLAGVWAGFSASAGWLLDRSLTKPAETAGTLVVLGASGYILVNALGFQEGRHPAPILPQARQTTGRDAKPVARQEKPAVRQEASERAKADPIALPQKSATSEGSQSSASAALAQLVEETTASVTPKADKSVKQAQQALTKLGYGPLKDDGVYGRDTRAAIEKFEREHKLAVTGEAAGLTLKDLAARAAHKH